MTAAKFIKHTCVFVESGNLCLAFLYFQIGMGGLRAAMEKTNVKLWTPGKLTQRTLKLHRAAANDPVVQAVLHWRDHVAKLLDRNVNSVILNSKFQCFITWVRNSGSDVDSNRDICKLRHFLAQSECPSDVKFKEWATLLANFLSGKERLCEGEMSQLYSFGTCGKLDLDLF